LRTHQSKSRTSAFRSFGTSQASLQLISLAP
jgi:hypothetical protein